MKIKTILLASLLITSVSSCREESDYMLNPNDGIASYWKTYTDQFKVVWNAINTGYSFWDVQKDIDWDQRYCEYEPQFQQLDTLVAFCKKSNDSIGLDSCASKYERLYKGLFAGFKDHHMILLLRNPKDEMLKLQPGTEEIKTRSYYHDRTMSRYEFYRKFLPSLQNDSHVEDFQISDSMGVTDITSCVCSFKYRLSDGRIIPYFWSLSFPGIQNMKEYITENETATDTEKQEIVAHAKKVLEIMNNYRKWVVETPHEQLAGVVIDVRENDGGYMSDLPMFIGTFMGKSQTFLEYRYKEGMGRYDMSAWLPMIISTPKDSLNRDLGAENIPLVCLADQNTVSCAENTAHSVKSLPTGYVIGERTWGAYGPLMDSNSYSILYAGVVGDYDRLGYYIYTSNFEVRPLGGECLEGIGIEPNETVLYNTKGFQGQFDAAIRYIDRW